MIKRVEPWAKIACPASDFVCPFVDRYCTEKCLAYEEEVKDSFICQRMVVLGMREHLLYNQMPPVQWLPINTRSHRRKPHIRVVEATEECLRMIYPNSFFPLCMKFYNLSEEILIVKGPWECQYRYCLFGWKKRKDKHFILRKKPAQVSRKV